MEAGLFIFFLGGKMSQLEGVKRRVCLTVPGIGVIEATGTTAEEIYQDFEKQMDEWDLKDKEISLWVPDYVRAMIREFLKKQEERIAKALVC